MSRIFAAVALASVLLIGAGALTAADDSVDSESELLNDILQMFATSLELSALLPLALLVGLLLATLGVFGRL